MGRRARRWAGPALTALVLVVTVGCGGQPAPPVELAAPDAAATEAPEPPPTTAAVDPAGAPSARASLGAAPRPSAKPTPSRTRRPDAPRPPVRELTETGAPPAPPAPAANTCPPSYRGRAVSRAQAKAALTEAASRTYWPVSAPEIKIPLALVKAVAWQESGWQSNIVACDGGIGLMQIQPETAAWMNQRFEQDYDVSDHRDNAYLGGTYLAWLTKKIGDTHFRSDYRLDASRCTGAANSCLLNAVIAAYNFGIGAVIPQEEKGPVVIPNAGYVDNVRTLMRTCACLGF
ncbi:transglycosylase SLT domain-containing protein [Micromonospora sp. NPDC000089]|uniref:transglycosylase SLT domain-containing protein n=1 Tax=unclassified Micromonospora TaxID=2617518 RepID=UPI0036A60067